ncbi:ATP-binding cassette sub-family A member 2-like isoform X2 [Anneissia japonica]|uniref:ATP-binding cassette sub-family A member 2-like isoform X2 n=1 Tax=Anneissia japonica TaxID=1529436 RepID=UPI001425995C|nr:ATP-binding cassette sub-family A member 2-like isoform X2 [Anneissia japonica]
MGFLHQLRLLLWKNLVLKKRSPIVVLFELIIPLVLFFILLSIRSRNPSEPKKQQYFVAQPLPSAGVIPVLQQFCPRTHRDNFGFPNYPNAQVRPFLEELYQVIQDNDLYPQDFPISDLEKMPDALHELLADYNTIENQFSNSQDLVVISILNDPAAFEDYLVRNLSIPEDEADQIIHSEINTQEIFRLLYGNPPRPINDSPSKFYNYTDFQMDLNHRLSGIDNGMVYRPYSNKDIFTPDGIADVLSWTGGLTRTQASIKAMVADDSNTTTPLNATELVEDFKDNLVSPDGLQDIACNKRDIAQIFNTSRGNITGDYLSRLCNEEGASDVFEEFSQVLRDQLNSKIIADKLNISLNDLMNTRKYAEKALADFQTFATFEKHLYDLYVLASKLPEGNCPKPPEPATTTPSIEDVEMTTVKSKVSEGVSDKPDDITTVPSNTVSYDSGDDNDDMLYNASDTDENFFTTVTTQMHTKMKVTPVPLVKPKKKAEDAKKKRKISPQKKKLLRLYRLWANMQPVLCGKEVRTATDEQMENGDYKALGFDHHQKRSFEILVHILFSNPKILYAPNTTDVNAVINQASDFIFLFNNMTHLSNVWLNVSKEIREQLFDNRTERAVEWMAVMQKELYNHNMLFPNISLNVFPREYIYNATNNATSVLLKELNTIDNAACAWLEIASYFNMDIFKPFPSEEALVDYVLHQAAADNVTVLANVVFQVDRNGELPPHTVFKIRQNSSFTDRTDLIRKRYWTPGSNHRNILGYYTYGFVWIQDLIERAIIDMRVQRKVTEPGNYVQEFPYPCYRHDKFLFTIEHIMPMIMIISWVYYVSMLTQSIVYEKEKGLKEVMKLMGLSNAVHWVAWFITSFLEMSITIIGLVCILKYGDVLVYSNPVIVWLVLTTFSIATISFCFMVSVLFSKARLAAACAGIMYFTSYVPYLYIGIREETAFQDISLLAKSIGSLLSTTAFGLAAKYFALYEEEGVGVQWSNIHLSPVEQDEFNLLKVIIMMVIDAFLYLILTWYIEAVHPGSYGLPRPFYFPLQWSYWFGNSSSSCCPGSQGKYSNMSLMDDDQSFAMAEAGQGPHMEPEPYHLNMGVSIKGLTKVYKTGKKLAVNNLSLNLYEGQITSFLGHNGAGKTTTMSILTGLFPPTNGTATIYGNDIRSDMLVIRKSLGMCPQHNALFDKLTVEEHVWFYARLKGTPSSCIKKEMDKVIGDIGLMKKRKQKVKGLSGGMKRKLSVAIAFVGGSRTIILDEPTSGVDPYARRAIWELLLKYKSGRTILLSTHHMDEADLLGDRIAIISHGQLKCCGSSLFLKATFGDGYRLTLVKRRSETDSSNGSISSDSALSDSLNASKTSASFHSNASEATVTSFIKTYIRNAELTSETIQELSYILPSDAQNKGMFEKFFNALEENMSNLEITSYGLADTSLEDVFLKVSEKTGANSATMKDDKKSSNSWFGCLTNSSCRPSEMELQDVNEEPSTSSGSSLNDDDDVPLLETEETPPIVESGEGLDISTTYVTGFFLYTSQFYALFVKRLHHIKRNRKGLFSQLLLPVFFICVAMTVALAAPLMGDLPPLILTPSQYHPLTNPRGNFIPHTNEALNPRQHAKIYHSIYGDATPEQLTETLKMPSGVGATCVVKTPFNSTLDVQLKELNYSSSIKLTDKYYDSMCRQSFKKGHMLKNYVPEPPKPVTKYSPIAPEQWNENGTSRGAVREITCRCSDDNTGFSCPVEVGSPYPEVMKVITSDRMLNVDRRNITRYILYTTDKYRLHRYGAFSVGNVREYVPKMYQDMSAPEYRKIAVRNAAMAFHNHKGFHSMPTYINVINNLILRANLDPDIHGNPAGYGITAINHPMNKTSYNIENDYIVQEGTNMVISIFIIVAMSFVPASFVVFLVAERSSKAKHLQFISSVNPAVYWLCNFLWDMMNYMVPASCCILILKLFNIPAYASPTNLPAVIILFLLYGYSITPMMYPASFYFNESSAAYVFLIIINLFTGITTVIASFMLELFNYDEELKEVYEFLHKAFLMFPNYCLGKGLMDLAYNEFWNEFYYKIGEEDKAKMPFEWDVMTRMYVIMGIEGLAAFIFTILLEYKFFIRPIRRLGRKRDLGEEDEDVADERRRVLSGEANDDILRIENLTKVFKSRYFSKHYAVDRLCLGVPQGECFGLLGVNGAGKTTTFKMLTGDQAISKGDAFLNGISILKNRLAVYRCIGYCPQLDALFDELTAREHLHLYARLKGIPKKDENKLVDWALRKLALVQYSNRPAGTYSGGNKRKLSTAIALIGRPQVIFMDEPTTGMDPHSRRFLWDLILSMIKEGRSVVLTSHSMEECEALCGRLAILVNGRFKCLGSIQHLKNKFGGGYTVSIRVKGPQPNTAPVKQFFLNEFSDAELKDEHHNMLQYGIMLSNTSLSELFSRLESMKGVLQIEDYSVSQTTLDNVFINFAKEQMGQLDDFVDSSKELNVDSSLQLQNLMRASSNGTLDLEDDDDEPLLQMFGQNEEEIVC